MADSIWIDLLGAEVRFRGNKYRTRTIEAGTGKDKALFLLHGVGGHAEAWAKNVVRLGEQFHTIAMDFLWHGYSDCPKVPESRIKAYAEQILDVMDSMGYEKASIEGESLGGWVAMYLALHHPERLERIVLNTTAGVSYKPGSVNEDKVGGIKTLFERSLAAVTDPTRETVAARLRWLMADPNDVTDELVALRQAIYNHPPTRAAQIEMFTIRVDQPLKAAGYLAEEEVAKIGVPTLVFWTDKNPGHGPDAGERLASLIAEAGFYVMKNAGHWPQWEHPEEHDRVIADFIGV